MKKPRGENPSVNCNSIVHCMYMFECTSTHARLLACFSTFVHLIECNTLFHRFYWSKVEGHNDPKRKYISLANQVIDNGVTCSRNRWSITNSNGKRIDLEVINTLKDDAVAADWAEVAGALASTSA